MYQNMPSMTQSDKLRALIQKATQNGFDGNAARHWLENLMVDDWETSRRQTPILIFNHDFAKALFGEGEIPIHPSTFGRLSVTWHGKPTGEPFDDIYKNVVLIPACDYRLQRAVIADNPIDYMYDVICGLTL